MTVLHGGSVGWWDEMLIAMKRVNQVTDAVSLQSSISKRGSACDTFLWRPTQPAESKLRKQKQIPLVCLRF